MPSESELNDKNSASRASQQISRRNRSELRFVRNLEKQALNTTGNSERRREIRDAADDMRAIISARTTDERGKLEEGIIYDSKQYAKPTFNSDGTADKATDDRGIDSINSESTPGNSQRGASGGVPNDNSTPSDEPDDGSVRPNDWYHYANEGNRNLALGFPPARGTINNAKFDYTTLDFSPLSSSEGFTISTSSGEAKISIKMGDLASNASAADPAKFREVKVCLNGVPATMSVLGTKPVASP